ncbi:MAG TPA: tetratricopeptide repeat protein [Thermoanaerobaculia bacterium]|nr:tetratricopeptide repeat protein [Thermoanaerobaculia bacterium]
MQTGRVFIHPAAARGRFRELADLPEERLDLGEASLVIALEEYPRLDVPAYLERIERWAHAVRERTEGSADPERILAQINRLLFEEEGFHGEGDDYYDPKGALLNEVLDRHAGLPLALSIVYIEISRRAGLPAAGVSLPGRFLVRVAGSFGEIVIDPFDSGRVLTGMECQRIMDQVFGGAVKLSEHHLRPFGKREILARVLAHLKASHLAHRNVEAAIAAIDRILILDENDPYELRDRGMMAMQLHRYGEATRFLERYLAAMPSAEDCSSVREQIEWIRAWLDEN